MSVKYSNIVLHKIKNRLSETIIRAVFKGVKTMSHSWAGSHGLKLQVTLKLLKLRALPSSWIPVISGLYHFN